MIRTEIFRAQNLSGTKFYQTVSIQKVTWNAAADERACIHAILSMVRDLRLLSIHLLPIVNTV